MNVEIAIAAGVAFFAVIHAVWMAMWLAYRKRVAKMDREWATGGYVFGGDFGLVGERRDPPHPLFTAEHCASRSPRSLGKTEGPIPSKK
ncbi:hypothetical protein DSD19_06195 [Rhodovulum sp. BSW8]|uniref:hypothetical protein n=1 Tax=Rhodovulum sp. BSW8 TaxID=2259645 RepID=UPI000DE1FBB8|nr:hypothetical protein [Rhodovulum sp. BSW8]RBO54050.1 hypothetical protein DSD19_06195 [Rhodovulum sp. BSW8]